MAEMRSINEIRTSPIINLSHHVFGNPGPLSENDLISDKGPGFHFSKKI
jgi:hypothetical protein